MWWILLVPNAISLSAGSTAERVAELSRWLYSGAILKVAALLRSLSHLHLHLNPPRRFRWLLRWLFDIKVWHCGTHKRDIRLALQIPKLSLCQQILCRAQLLAWWKDFSQTGRRVKSTCLLYSLMCVAVKLLFLSDTTNLSGRRL